jgi:hypothetical protein
MSEIGQNYHRGGETALLEKSGRLETWVVTLKPRGELFERYLKRHMCATGLYHKEQVKIIYLDPGKYEDFVIV